MSDFYPIVEVQENWLLDPEESQEFIGSKNKFWYRPESDKPRWLFKYPRENSGEHWAEKIAESVARILDIPHSRVELAVFKGIRGSAAESFVAGELELFHGNQILAGTAERYDPDMRRPTKHTLENIWQALDSLFEDLGKAEEAKRQFSGYLILDGIIGNTDRHHANWGGIRSKRTESGVVEFLAPSFDHASSLGRELEDTRRATLLSENRVGRYSERGRGAIYWSQDDRWGRSPVVLALLAAERHPQYFRPTLANLDELSDSSLRAVVERIPECWMSSSAREFAIALMMYNLDKMREVMMR